MESTIDLIHINQFRDYFKMMNNDDGFMSWRLLNEKSQLSRCSLDVLKEERGERDLSKVEKPTNEEISVKSSKKHVLTQVQA